jgi:hypothetical protein
MRLVRLFFAKIPYSFEVLAGVLGFLAYYNILLGLYKKIKKEESRKLVNIGIRIFSCFWAIVSMIFAFKGGVSHFAIGIMSMYIARDGFGFSVETENFDKIHFILGILFLLSFVSGKIVRG